MRIGITMLSHDETWGGPGVYTREIVRSLLRVDDRNEYVLIYPRFGRSAREIGRYAEQHANAREVQTGPCLPLGTLWEQVAVPPVARRHALDVLFNPFWSVPVVAPVLGGYRTVMIVHNTEYHTVPGVYTWRIGLEWALHNALWIHRADRVISISDVISRDLERYVRLPAERIRRVYHGCHERFRRIDDAAALEAARARHGLRRPFLLYVGMIFPQKNFGNLLRAFASLRDQIPHELVVVGAPRWKFKGELELVTQLGIGERVRFLGHVPNEELPAFYSLADCFVYPSLYEAFGLAGVEAMACGCPVAGANAAAIPEVLGDAAVLFDPQRPDDMAASILRILSDPELRDRCVRRGLERAKLFSWTRAARETLAVFEELASRPH